MMDIGADPTPLKYRGAQYNALSAWYETMSPEELQAQLDEMIEIARSYGFEPKDDPETQVAVLVLQGEVDEAVEVALAEVFTDPVGMHLSWERDYSQSMFTDFVADPRVQTALANWEAEEAALRANVRRFLSDLQAST